jgi:hypothetical protein
MVAIRPVNRSQLNGMRTVNRRGAILLLACMILVGRRRHPGLPGRVSRATDRCRRDTRSMKCNIGNCSESGRCWSSSSNNNNRDECILPVYGAAQDQMRERPISPGTRIDLSRRGSQKTAARPTTLIPQTVLIPFYHLGFHKSISQGGTGHNYIDVPIVLTNLYMGRQTPCGTT